MPDENFEYLGVRGVCGPFPHGRMALSFCFEWSKNAEKHIRETLFRNNQWDSTFLGPQTLRGQPFCNLQIEGIKHPSPVSVDSRIVRRK